MVSLRIIAGILGLGSCFAAIGMVAVVNARSTEWNVEQIDFLKLVRAGLQCTVSRTEALPSTLSAGEFPMLCRSLMGSETLRAMSIPDRFGYRKVGKNHYRLCAGFRGEIHPANHPAIDGRGCIEETLPGPTSLRWRPRHKKA